MLFQLPTSPWKAKKWLKMLNFPIFQTRIHQSAPRREKAIFYKPRLCRNRYILAKNFGTTYHSNGSTLSFPLSRCPWSGPEIKPFQGHSKIYPWNDTTSFRRYKQCAQLFILSFLLSLSHLDSSTHSTSSTRLSLRKCYNSEPVCSQQTKVNVDCRHLLRKLGHSFAKTRSNPKKM